MPKEAILPLTQKLHLSGNQLNNRIPFDIKYPYPSTVVELFTPLTPHPSRISSVFPVSSTHASTALHHRRYNAIPFCRNCNSLHTDSDPLLGGTVRDGSEQSQPIQPPANQPIKLSANAGFLSTLLSRVTLHLLTNSCSQRFSI